MHPLFGAPSNFRKKKHTVHTLNNDEHLTITMWTCSRQNERGAREREREKDRRERGREREIVLAVIFNMALVVVVVEWTGFQST